MPPRRLTVLLLVLVVAACGRGESPAEAAPPPAQDGARREVAVCRRLLLVGRAYFEAMPGVIAAVSGFAGGATANPSYDQVVRGGTGHLEAVQVTFDPSRITYRQLVDRFWRTIDPTDAAGQFCDRGPSYGTAVFATAAQKAAAEASRRAAAAALPGRRFVTPIRDAVRFWPAEAYHQDFARRNPVRYGGYSRFCGREARLREVWGPAAPVAE